MPEIARRMVADVTFLQGLSSAFCSIRLYVPAIAHALKLQHHPGIRDLLDTRDGRAEHASKLFKPLVPLVYHAHPLLQLNGHMENKNLQKGKQL